LLSIEEETVRKYKAMKKTIMKVVLATGMCCLVSFVASAQLVQMRLVSSAYGWQQQDTIGQSSNHLLGYQTVQLSLSGERFSFHTYLQGFNEFIGPLKNKPETRFYDFYLKYAKLFDLIDASVGRVPVFAGVGNGIVDGGIVSARFLDTHLKVLGYGGALPETNEKFELIGDTKHNNMFGGQITASPSDYVTASVSYMRKNIQPDAYWAMRAYDSTYTLQNVEITPMMTAEECLSGDVNLDYYRISGYARYDRDLLQKQMSRVQLFVRLKLTEPLSVTGEYLQRAPLLSYNSIFWVFAYSTLSEYDAGVEYALNKDVQVYGKYGFVSYGGGDQTSRVTLGSNTKYISANLAWNTGFGGQLAAVSANAGYPLFNNMLTPMLIASYAQYKLSNDAPLSNALSVGAGTVYRPLRELSFDAQVQWITNTIYNKDVRVFLRASYFFSHQLNLF